MGKGKGKMSGSEPRPLAPITQMPFAEEAWRHIPLSLLQLLGAPRLALAAACTDTHEWFYIHIRARNAAPLTSPTPPTAAARKAAPLTAAQASTPSPALNCVRLWSGASQPASFPR